MNSTFFRAARLFLLATLAFAPLAFGAVQPWAWGTMGVMSAIILLLWTAGNVSDEHVAFTWSWLYVPAGLLFLFVLFQSLAHVSVDAASTREANVKLATCLIFFLVTGQLYGRAQRKSWDRFGTFVILFAAGLALFGIIQCFSSPRMIYWQVKSPNDDFGPYVDRDHYAGLMEMLIPIAAAYTLSLKDGMIRSILASFGVLIAVVSLLLTGCRGGFLALIVEFLLFAGIAGTFKKDRQRMAMGLAGVAVIVASVGLWFTVAPDDIPARLATVVRFRDPAVNPYRAEVTADTLHIFRRHLATGAGLGAFEAIYPQYQTFSSEYIWDHAHDDYAEFLAETGLPGAFLAGACLVIFAYAGLFKRLRHRARETEGWLQLGAALGCCGLLVHSFFDFNLHIPANALWFSVCVALATLKTPVPRRARVRRVEVEAEDSRLDYDVSESPERAIQH